MIHLQMSLGAYPQGGGANRQARSDVGDRPGELAAGQALGAIGVDLRDLAAHTSPARELTLALDKQLGGAELDLELVLADLELLPDDAGAPEREFAAVAALEGLDAELVARPVPPVFALVDAPGSDLVGAGGGRHTRERAHRHEGRDQTCCPLQLCIPLVVRDAHGECPWPRQGNREVVCPAFTSS